MRLKYGQIFMLEHRTTKHETETEMKVQNEMKQGP